MPSTGQHKTRRRRTHQKPRRKRSLSWRIDRHLDRILRSPKLFRVGLGLLLVAGFLGVSFVNDVLSPGYEGSYSSTSEHSVLFSDKFTVSNSGAPTLTSFYPSQPDEQAEVPPSNAQQAISVTPLASTWLNGDLWSLTTLPLEADDVDVQQVARANGEPRESDAAATGPSAGTTATYVVNEGGSLWRAGKRFLNDDVVLDKLIDNLADSGMNVRSVSAGVAFTVIDLGSEGMRVIVNDDGNTYESYIIGSRVTTSRREAAVDSGDGAGT